MKKHLILLRGLPGSGKSTLAKSLGGDHVFHVEADHFFMVDGEYRFRGDKLKQAHEWCQSMVQDQMFLEHPLIIVSNTFTQEWEMESYFKMAENFGYRVSTVILENRHQGKNIHGVPDEKLEAMKNRFEVKL